MRQAPEHEWLQRPLRRESDHSAVCHGKKVATELALPHRENVINLHVPIGYG
jgi:hypothetical protein